MHVNEAGHQRSISKVDRLRAGRTVHVCTSLNDFPVLDCDFAGRENLSGFHVEQAGCVEDYRTAAARCLS